MPSRAELLRRVVCGDNLDVLRGLEDGRADLIYVDPPFNTGKRQERTRTRTESAFVVSSR